MYASTSEPLVAGDHTRMLVPASKGARDCLSTADPPLCLHASVATPASWHGSPSQTSVVREVVKPSISLAGSFDSSTLSHLPDSLANLGPSTMHTAAGSACMVSTQPILHLLQTPTSMQPAGQPACIGLCPSNGPSTMPQQQQQLVLVQPQHSQLVLMQQQPVLQDPPGLLPASMRQQQQRLQLWPLDDQILQEYRSSTLFYAGVLPIATDEGLLGVFEQFGRVVSLEQFKPYRDSKTSKGCGLVVFASQDEATCAMEALGNKFVWPGARSPIVIEWSSKHKRPKQQQQPRQRKRAPQAAQEASNGQGAAPAVHTAAVVSSVQQAPGSCAMHQPLLAPLQQLQPQAQHVLVHQPDQQQQMLEQPQQLQQQHVLVQHPHQQQQVLMVQPQHQQQQVLLQQPPQLQQQVLMQQPQQVQFCQQQQQQVLQYVLVPVTHVPLVTPYPMGPSSSGAVGVTSSQPAMLVRF